jgi:hypothetical protein
MKRLFIGLIAGAIGGTLFGFSLGIFIYPFWFLQEPAMERLTQSSTRIAVAQGSFIHVNKSDPIHWGKGSTTVYRESESGAVVFLHDDFEVGPGPRFHVYLVDHANVQGGDDFENSRHIDLGRLRAFKGSQVYQVPAGTDLAAFKSVVIWCKEFGVLIAPASLVAPAAKAAQLSSRDVRVVPPRILRREPLPVGRG